MRKIVISFVLFFLLSANLLTAQVSVLTQHNDNARTGANLQETRLDITTVDTSHFGKLCSRNVDDQVYAQPLVVSGVDIPGYGVRNVLYIATVNNSVYAYDADDRLIVNPFWNVNLTPAGSRVIRALDYSQAGVCGGAYTDFTMNIGIVSTPVIDTTTNTIYVLTKNIVTLTGEYEQWLHALDIRDGSEKPMSPVLIEATFEGTGDGSINGTISFNAQHENQRCALLLSQSVIYITWAGYCDWPPYHGWVLGYDSQTLQRVHAWMNTPNGIDGGNWMCGAGISADENGNLYLSSGNGTSRELSDSINFNNYGESIVKLTPVDTALNVSSFFTPFNHDFLSSSDLDLGTASVMLIPNTNWAVTAGKEGILYLLDRDTMGGLDTIDHVMQKIMIGSLGTETHGGTVYWHSDSADYIYLWPAQEYYLLGYKIDYQNARLDSTMRSSMVDEFKPGGILSLSANGSTLGSGIVWANVPLEWPGNANRPGILRAFDASDLSHELWNSQMNTGRDSINNYAKFVAPTIANGRVYMATFSGSVNMYGIFNPDGVEEVSNQLPSIQVYPNPLTNGLLHFSKPISFYLYDEVGQELLCRKKTKEVDVSAFEKGIYFIRSDEGVSAKIIKLN